MDLEKHRLHTLRMYQILDSATEKAFDDLASLASAMCDAPISLVSFVDKDRQWFKAKIGVEVSETPREYAFCAHAIESDDIMIVEDATRDNRFANNPLVNDDPKIRFYAGVPLVVSNGQRLGTLCVIDQHPRTLSEAQLRGLTILRNAVVAQLELRKAALELNALQSFLPMCAWCGNIRVDRPEGESWYSLEEYMQKIGSITHGICPKCSDSIKLD